MPDRAWRDPDVQRALAEWDFGEMLRLVRKRSGLSQTAVRDLTALPQSFISGLERGTKRIGRPETLLDLLSGLALPPDLHPVLLTPLADRTGPAAASEFREVELPWTTDRMVASLDRLTGGAAVKRRALAAVTGAALTQYVLQSALAPLEGSGFVGGPSTAGDALVNTLQSTTDQLRKLDASGGSGTLAETGKAHLRTLLHLLKEGSVSQQTGKRIAAVAADTAAQTGWYTFDGGNHDEAQQFFLGALRAAHASGDPRLRAGALGFLAIHAYSVGDPRDAVMAARAGRQAIAAQDAPALNAMLLTRQARGHAKLGEERYVRAALDEASELCVAGRGEDDPHWLYWISQGEILGQTGSCYLDLGHTARAAEAFTSARDVLRRDETRTTAQFLSRAATAQMRAGNVDAGCAIGHEVLALAEGIQSARLDEHLRTMLHDAHAYRASSSAQDLVERGRDAMRERSAL